jgi:superfamily II DNA/RNA helicase
MSTTFASLGLPDTLVQTLAKRNITEPFPIQTSAIPDGLEGRDIRGKAPTGSGKTLAFGLPLLTHVDRAGSNRPKALILAPTRELAEQIKVELGPLAHSVDRKVFAIYGGVAYGGQKGALRRGVDVLVATPGRLEDLIEQRSVNLSEVSIVVIDEADRMADMGFFPAVKRILDQTSNNRQTLLFSATLDRDVAALSRRYQDNPVSIETAPTEQDAVDAVHHFWRVNRDERVTQTADLVTATGRSIVFTRTRRGADRLAKQLERNGVGAVAMHGGRSQAQRTRALKSFASGRTPALVATDVAARGIHVDDVACVVHYDLPGDHKDYTHRSGRTARAGAAGTVVTMVLPDQEREVRRLQRELKMNTPIERPRMDRLDQTGGSVKHDRPQSKRSQDQGKPSSGSRSIFVGNLPWKASDNDLRELFSRHGHVHETSIAKQRAGGRSKGYGFVEMSDRDSSVAIKALQGTTLGGRDLQIRFARP